MKPAANTRENCIIRYVLVRNNVNTFSMLHVLDFVWFLIVIEVDHDILNIHNNYSHEFSNLIAIGISQTDRFSFITSHTHPTEMMITGKTRLKSTRYVHIHTDHQMAYHMITT